MYRPVTHERQDASSGVVGSLGLIAHVMQPHYPSSDFYVGGGLAGGDGYGEEKWRKMRKRKKRRKKRLRAFKLVAAEFASLMDSRERVASDIKANLYIGRRAADLTCMILDILKAVEDCSADNRLRKEFSSLPTDLIVPLLKNIKSMALASLPSQVKDDILRCDGVKLDLIDSETKEKLASLISQLRDGTNSSAVVGQQRISVSDQLPTEAVPEDVKAVKASGRNVNHAKALRSAEKKTKSSRRLYKSYAALPQIVKQYKEWEAHSTIFAQSHLVLCRSLIHAINSAELLVDKELCPLNLVRFCKDTIFYNINRSLQGVTSDKFIKQIFGPQYSLIFKEWNSIPKDYDWLRCLIYARYFSRYQMTEIAKQWGLNSDLRLAPANFDPALQRCRFGKADPITLEDTTEKVLWTVQPSTRALLLDPTLSANAISNFTNSQTTTTTTTQPTEFSSP